MMMMMMMMPTTEATKRMIMMKYLKMIITLIEHIRVHDYDDTAQVVVDKKLKCCYL